MTDEPRRVPVNIVARHFSVNGRTVRRWCENGTIPADQFSHTLGGHLRICLGWLYVHAASIKQNYSDKADKADK